MPRINEDKKERKNREKKRLIIDALKRCLDREAYSYISLQTVADEAGVSKGGLRYYFHTKEAMFMELIGSFFTDIEKDHLGVIGNIDLARDRAFLSTLYGIERFVLNTRNIKIFLNLVLYGLEDNKIMGPIREFFRNHLNLYEDIVRRAQFGQAGQGDNGFDYQFKARIAQIIFLSAGLLEEVDPIGMDPSRLTRYVISLFGDSRPEN
ncbi:MAG: TetR/AcrR family transcriptional regulator [Spirochaetes bacterium]|nr:MAG: TetR/AcrR family transcriptional regulator [Spirochaetota bacterium]